MELTIEKAYELAVKKWEWVVAHDGDPFDPVAIPELKNMSGYCGYCHYFLTQRNKTHDCTDCPLNLAKNPERNGCCDPNHPWEIWLHNNTTETAQAVLDLIIKTKPF